MATYYNKRGGTTIVGTSTGTDHFYAFTKDGTISQPFADAVLASLVRSTAMWNPDGSRYTITASNIQVSFDVYQGNGGVDMLHGSDAADGVFYNSGVFGDGVGGISGIQRFKLYGGDDVFDFTGHNGGNDFRQDLFVYAGTGNDTIVGGAGKDKIEGEDGNDLIFGWRGGDDLRGGAGDDTIYGDDFGYSGIVGNDIIKGHAGNDVLHGGNGDDELYGGDDNDTLHGGSGWDLLLGGNGDDLIYGDVTWHNLGQADIINGAAGNDRIDGGGGNDWIHGGTEIDTAIYSGARGDYLITLNADGSYTVADQRTQGNGRDTLYDVELVEFSDGTFAITALNTPPTITSTGGGAAASVALAETTAQVTVVGSDGVLDQAIFMNGMNSTALFDTTNII